MPRFVGRQPQLDELEDALEAAVAGRGGLALICGDPGIGKSRLGEELAERAAARQVNVAWARCWESAAVLPFRPWEELLRQVTDDPFPISDRGAAAEDPEIARILYFDRIATVVARAAAAGPLMLVVDDVQWADVGSIRLLSDVASRLTTLPVLVVATLRDAAPAPTTAAGSAIAELARHGLVVRLDGMNVEEIGALVRGVGDDVDTAALHHHTRGNPLFAQELVRLLKAQGALGGLVRGGVVPVPPTVRAVLSHRLEGCSPDCRAVLDVAAVVGEDFGLAVVEAVAGFDRPRLLDALAEALEAGLLVSAGIGTYAFAHPLVRASVYDELGMAGRVRMHERVGLTLESAGVEGRAVDPAVLAHHFVEAAPGGAAARGARYAVAAAEKAMTSAGYDTAVDFYEKALGALALDPTAADRGEVLLGLGGAQLATAGLPAARATYLAAADLARTTDRPDQLARAALGVGGGGGFEVAMSDRQQVDLLEEALRRMDPEPSVLRALVTARLSVALSLGGVEERRLALSAEALAIARRTGDSGAIAHALAARCDATAGPAHSERRLREATEIVALARGMGDAATELLGRRMRLVALLEMGDTPAADSEIEGYSRLADLVRQPLYGWYVPLWRGMRALMRGELAAADSFCQAAVELGGSAGSDNAIVLGETLKWYVHREAADTESPLSLLGDLLSGQAPVLGAQVRVSATLIVAEAGRVEEARARLDADASVIRALPQDSEWVATLGQVAGIVTCIGGHSLASWAYDALLPYRHRFGVEGIGAVWWGSVERPLGQLAASLGRADDATAHFDAAAQANRDAGSPLYLAAALRDAGVALGDRDRMMAAQRAYRDLGITRQVAALEASLASNPPAAISVFRRDGEVWTFVFDGRTARLKHVKGLGDLAFLLARPGREISAYDLAGTPGGPLEDDAGEVLDARARAAYRARLAQIDAELEHADISGDDTLSARAHHEREALLAQLSAAVGLGGRPRRVGATAERARQAVTWRVRDALRRIEAVHPELGEHLRRSVRTGTYCAYAPPDPVDWTL